MATDYDTPRKTDEELHEESLEELKAQRADAQSGQVDIDEAEAAENLELPGADLSGEELSVKVVPKQEDEFTCSRCFLVKHVNQRVRGEGPKAVCRDCDQLRQAANAFALRLEINQYGVGSDLSLISTLTPVDTQNLVALKQAGSACTPRNLR